MSHTATLCEVDSVEETVEQTDGVRHADGSIHYADGTIDHPDGTVELNGYFCEINWDDLDPPEGHPDAEEVPHEVVKSEICALLRLAPGTL